MVPVYPKGFHARTPHTGDFTASDASLKQLEDALRRQAPPLSSDIQQEFKNIARERDPAFRAQALLQLGLRLKNSQREIPARAIFQSLSEYPGNASLALRARQELDALEGKGLIGQRAEVLIGRTSQEATNYRTILPMLAGTVAGGILRATVMKRLAGAAPSVLTRAWGARAVASGLALAGEVPTFVLSGRALRSGEEKSSLGRELASAGVTLGLLKVFGGAARFLPVAFQGVGSQLSTFFALASGHQIQVELGWQAGGDKATAFSEILASMVSLGVGAHLGQRVLGSSLTNFHGELALRSDAASSGDRDFTPPWNLGVREANSVPLGTEVPSYGARGLSPSLSGRPGLLHSFGMGLRLGQKLELRLSNHMKNVHEDWVALYENAEKRRYQKHGLDFEYAVVRRAEFPYMLYIGSAGLHYGGMSFVMEDFFLDPAIGEDIRRRLVEMIAVHEYGEKLFADHHEASLLEFAVAEKEGFLADYLEFLKKGYFLKFRDIALHRMGDAFQDAMADIGIEVGELAGAESPVSNSDSALTARALKDGFRWPAGTKKYARFLDEDPELAKGKIYQWAQSLAVNEQIRGHLLLAGEKSMDAFRLDLDHGQPWTEALQDLEAAFYSALFPLKTEWKTDVYPKKAIRKDLVQASLADLQEGIRLRAHNLLHAKITDAETRAQALAALAQLPLFRQSLAEILKSLEKKSYLTELFLPFEDNDSPAFQELVALAFRRRQAFARLEAGLKSKDVGPGDTHQIREKLRYALDSHVRTVDEFSEKIPVHAVLHLTAEAMEGRKHPPLEALAAGLLWERTNDRSALRQMDALRARYGERLERYPRWEKNSRKGGPSTLEMHWKTQILIEEYESSNEDRRARIAEELYHIAGSTVNDEARGASPSLAAQVALRHWRTISPLDASLAPVFLPYWLTKHDLSAAQGKALMEYDFLRLPIWEQLERDPMLLNDLLKNSPLIRLEYWTPYTGFPAEHQVRGEFFQHQDLRETVEDVRLYGLEAARRLRIDAYASQSRGLPDDWEALNRLAQFRPRRSKWRSNMFDEFFLDWRHPMHLDAPARRSVLPDLLRYESATDLLEFLDSREDRDFSQQQRVDLFQQLTDFDRVRREAWKRWFDTWQGGVEPDLTPAVVDFPGFAKMAARHAKTQSDFKDVLIQIVDYYRLLLLDSNPHLQNSSLDDFPVYEVRFFQDYGDPRLKEAETFAIAAMAHTQELNTLATLAETDEELRRKFLAIPLKKNRFTGYAEGAKLLGLFARWDLAKAWDILTALASEGSIEALGVIAQSPQLADPDSVLRRTYLNKLKWEELARKDLPAEWVERLMRNGAVAAFRYLPIKDKTRSLLAAFTSFSPAHVEKLLIWEENSRLPGNPEQERLRKLIRELWELKGVEIEKLARLLAHQSNSGFDALTPGHFLLMKVLSDRVDPPVIWQLVETAMAVLRDRNQALHVPARIFLEESRILLDKDQNLLVHFALEAFRRRQLEGK